MPDPGEKRDLVLNPGEYAYLQELTRGVIKTHVGPTIVNQTAQEQPVKFNPKTMHFERCSTLEQAVCYNAIATEGEYIELENPSSLENNAHPVEGAPAIPPVLRMGRKINIPGPVCFPLWPGQRAKTIGGHNLRSNQYAVVRIYNEDEARKNWGQGVVKATETAADTSEPPSNNGDGDEKSKPASVVTTDVTELDLTIGKLYNVKGTECSYYMPCTGVEVVPDENGNYVRDAETLERGETCVLIDQDGNKRYERGPQVVFPEPTEEFQKEEDGSRKSLAKQLTVISGVHVGVQAPYHDEVFDTDYVEGDEVFYTGKDLPVYYPRPEHKIISYSGREMHYAVAIPAGEGRYVMKREEGVVDTMAGPTMLLPNPVKEVIVRRALSDSEVRLWYPGKDGQGSPEALAYNRKLREMIESEDGDFVSEAKYGQHNSQHLDDEDDEDEGSRGVRSVGKRRNDRITRSTRFTKPRELVLDTRFDGVPVIQPWTGYAVMLVSKGSDTRDVIVGPKTILLDYDQTLEILSISTGTPKTDDRCLRTVYLRIKNNKVSDVIQNVRTADHVRMDIRLNFRVNFVSEYNGEEVDSKRWFEVENYAKLMCDHVRSMVKGFVRKIEKIDDFYADGVDIIRDLILGKKDPETGKRRGMFFKENGMLIEDVEIDDIAIMDDEVRRMLESAQFEAVAGGIRVAKAQRDLLLLQETEKVAQQSAQAKAQTKEVEHKLTKESIERELALVLQRVQNELQTATEKAKTAEAEETLSDLTAERKLARRQREAEISTLIAKAENDETLRALAAETESVVKRFTASQEGFSEALISLQSQETLAKVAEAMSVQQIIGGKNMVDVVQKMFAGSPLEALLGALAKKVAAPSDKREQRRDY